MYVYSCNALSAQFFAVDRVLNSYFMIMIWLCLCHHHYLHLLLSGGMHNLIYMSKRYKPLCNVKYTKSGTWSEGGVLGH